MRVFQFDDVRMQEAYDSYRDFLATKTPAEKIEMMEWGASFIEQLDARGELKALDSLRKASPSQVRIKPREEAALA